MSWDWDKIVSTKTAARESVDIVMDRGWGERLGRAQMRHAVLVEQQQRDRSNTALLDEVTQLSDEIEDLIEQKPDKVCTFVFRSIAPDRYERLVRRHPPTQTQRSAAAKLGRSVSFNEETFPQALIKACLVEPKLTGEQVDALWNGGGDDVDPDDPEAPIGSRFSSAELADLFITAQTANMSRTRIE
jgi:hypothetical protein